MESCTSVYCGVRFGHVSFSKTRKSIESLRQYRTGNWYTPEEIFSENSPVSKTSVRSIARKEIEYRCAICDNVGEHLRKPLVLQLDHINGISTDQRRDNLRWLCPNCHSQTDTFAGRNGATQWCKTCKIPTCKKTGYCSNECTPKAPPRIKSGNLAYINRCNEWPVDETLFLMVKETGFECTGRELGVTGNAVKKRLKKRGYELPKYYTQSKY